MSTHEHRPARRRRAGRCAATSVALARRHPRLLWTARWRCTSLAALAALAAPRLLGDLVEAVEDGTTVGHVDQIIAGARRLPGRCRRC